jgi:Amidase
LPRTIALTGYACDALGAGQPRALEWKEHPMPQTIDLTYLSIAEAGALFRRRELSPVELVNALLERSEQLQETLVPYVTLTPDLARQQARAAESAFLQGESASPLLGIPIAYKDIVMTKGIRTTCGSALHAAWQPTIDAAVVEKWRAAGAVMMGKLSTHEFAFGLQPPGHLLKPARNPWNPEHVPGGSSSGSGAALAAGLVLGAIGTDTGGSIRNPAAYCGITGLKPTYGRVSRYGIVTLSWSLDHAGPMARTAADVAVLLTALAGYDPRDPASAKVPAEDYTASLEQSVAGLRLALRSTSCVAWGRRWRSCISPMGNWRVFSQPSCCRRRTRITPKTWPSCRRNTLRSCATGCRVAASTWPRSTWRRSAHGASCRRPTRMCCAAMT